MKKGIKLKTKRIRKIVRWRPRFFFVRAMRKSEFKWAHSLNGRLVLYQDKVWVAVECDGRESIRHWGVNLYLDIPSPLNLALRSTWISANSHVKDAIRPLSDLEVAEGLCFSDELIVPAFMTRKKLVKLGLLNEAETVDS